MAVIMVRFAAMGMDGVWFRQDRPLSPSAPNDTARLMK
jgi:hypothetical protein